MNTEKCENGVNNRHEDRQTHHQLPERDLHDGLEPDRIVLPREVVLHVNGEEKGLKWVNVSLAVV